MFTNAFTSDVGEYISFSACHLIQADIIFLLDDSGSVGHQDFKKEIAFVEQFVQEFEIGPQYTQIGVITYDYNPHNYIHLDQFSDKSSFINGLQRIPYKQGATHTAEALKWTLTDGFVHRNGDRDSVRNILIVVTDGRSQDFTKTATVAKQVHNAGIETLAVGVGSQVRTRELQAIASDFKHVFHVNNYDALQSVREQLRDSVCAGNMLCSYLNILHYITEKDLSYRAGPNA